MKRDALWPRIEPERLRRERPGALALHAANVPLAAQGGSDRARKHG